MITGGCAAQLTIALERVGLACKDLANAARSAAVCGGEYERLEGCSVEQSSRDVAIVWQVDHASEEKTLILVEILA